MEATTLNEMWQSLKEEKTTVDRYVEDLFSARLPHTPQIVFASEAYNPFIDRNIVNMLGGFFPEMDFICLNVDAITLESERLATDPSSDTLVVYAKELTGDMYHHRHGLIGEAMSTYYNDFKKKVKKNTTVDELVQLTLPSIRLDAAGYFVYTWMTGDNQGRIDDGTVRRDSMSMQSRLLSNRILTSLETGTVNIIEFIAQSALFMASCLFDEKTEGYENFKKLVDKDPLRVTQRDVDVFFDMLYDSEYAK